MNAAPHYRQAAALLAAPTPAEERILARVMAVSLGRTTWDLVRRNEPALEELYRGAVLPECDWGPNFFRESTLDSTLSVQLSRLCRIAGLRIRHAWEQEEARAAVEESLKVFKVARDIGRGGTFLCKVIQLAVESQTVDIGAAYLPGQDAWTLQALADGLQRLPDAGTLRDTVQEEKRFVLEYARAELSTKSWSEVSALMHQGPLQEGADAVLRAAGDVPGLVRLTEAWATHMDELGAILMGPLDQVPAALAAFTQRHRGTNPLAVPFVRTTEGVAYAVARAEARLAMLRAALAVVRDGTDPRQAWADGGNGGALTCRPFKGGFELRAGLPFPGRPPAVLTVGRAQGVIPRLRSWLERLIR